MSTEPRQDPDCLFCRIVAGEVPADVVAQDEQVVAFRDVTPQAPVHVLVVPREHHADVATLAAADPDALVALVRLGSRIAQDEAGGQFRLVFNSGPDAGQSVYHVHGHVLGGRPLTWPPGCDRAVGGRGRYCQGVVTPAPSPLRSASRRRW